MNWRWVQKKKLKILGHDFGDGAKKHAPDYYKKLII